MQATPGISLEQIREFLQTSGGPSVRAEDDRAEPSQITRVVRLYEQGEPVQPKAYRRHSFATRYSRLPEAALQAQVYMVCESYTPHIIGRAQ